MELAHRKQQAIILRLVVSAGIGLHLVEIIEKRSEIQNTTVLPILLLLRFFFFIITPQYEALHSWFQEIQNLSFFLQFSFFFFLTDEL